MSPTPYIVMFSPAENGLSTPDHKKRLAELQASGLDVLQCESAPALYAEVQKKFQQGSPTVAMLAGGHTENCAAATYLHAMHPSVGIAAAVERVDEALAIQLLQSGVDNICPRSASTPLVVAMLCRLLARVSRQDISHVLPMVVAPKGWSLQDQGWVLASPEGIRIPLTTGERAFLTTLVAAPDMCATHEQLLEAVNNSYAHGEPPARPGRLGVLVSRLRRKFTQHNIEMPLKSVHNWGYMFTGQVVS
ncbi:winged helix-turn-helix domain-containing protein [Parapusillimonas sp. JC17]|uniref:winged helix-turn-helix domain-containing protein n=1 Tax=Parapusillimonas sp. JC17 TaxID=3445768 RepID=UPI003FA0EE88